MLRKSYNVLFVYALLFVDLLINITDNLLPAPSYVVVQPEQNQLEFYANNWSFAIFIVQLLAISCVIIDLVLHFFNVSDHVKQTAWLQRLGGQAEPMPQRVALKLVLDRYWWSLLVGLLYLVLTIILQIIRLDPNWHHVRQPSNEQRANLVDESGGWATPQSSFVSEDALTLSSLFWTDDKPIKSLLGKRRAEQTDLPLAASQLIKRQRPPGAQAPSLLPVLVVLVHKLMSTCYYVSFVVVYRATTEQMVARVLLPSGKLQQDQKRSQFGLVK